MVYVTVYEVSSTICITFLNLFEALLVGCMGHLGQRFFGLVDDVTFIVGSEKYDIGIIVYLNERFQSDFLTIWDNLFGSITIHSTLPKLTSETKSYLTIFTILFIKQLRIAVNDN